MPKRKGKLNWRTKTACRGRKGAKSMAKARLCKSNK